jgi:hypothetical protein
MLQQLRKELWIITGENACGGLKITVKISLNALLSGYRKIPLFFARLDENLLPIGAGSPVNLSDKASTSKVEAF